jgi:uroporphyrinogen-III synthase
MLRVVVCRAPDQAGDFVDRLRAHGVKPVVAPVIAIADPADGGAALRAACADLSDVELVILTSPNAATRFATALHDNAIDKSVWSQLRVMTVGPGTSHSAQESGLVVWRTATRNIAEGVIEELAHEPVGAGRILIPQAVAARPVLRERLVALGWRVDAPIAYRTMAVPLDAHQRDAVASAEAVAFTSASTVHALVDAVGLSAVPPIVISIGPQTSVAARDRGLSVSKEADPHTIAGLVEAVAAVAERKEKRAE